MPDGLGSKRPANIRRQAGGTLVAWSKVMSSRIVPAKVAPCPGRCITSQKQLKKNGPSNPKPRFLLVTKQRLAAGEAGRYPCRNGCLAGRRKSLGHSMLPLANLTLRVMLAAP